MASCRVCHATKYYTRATTGAEYYELPDEPGKAISVDIFEKLPEAKGKVKFILVIMDKFSKHVKLYLMTNQKTEAIIKKLENYFDVISVPSKILTDNAAQFKDREWNEFVDRYNITATKTTPYYPQSNPVERIMRELGHIAIARTYCSHNHSLWIKIIP